MKKKVLIPLIIVFLLLSVFVITAGLYVSDALPERVSYSISRFLNKIDGRPQNSEPAYSGSVTAIQIKPKMPEDMHAVTVDLSRELTTDPVSGTYGDLISETAYYYNYYKNFMVDTIFITPDYTGNFIDFADAYGNKVDVLREFIKYSDSSSYTKVLVLNEEYLYDDADIFSFDLVQYYLSNYSFDAVLLSAETLFRSGNISACAQYFAENIRISFGGTICFGVEIPAHYAVKGAVNDTLALLNADYIDFMVVEGSSLKSASMPFASVFSYWNSLAAGFPNITFYCKHRNDLVCTDQTEWFDYTEICNQVRLLWDCEYFKGSVFHDTTALTKNKNNSSLRLSYLLYDGELADLVVSSLDVDAQNNRVIFSGEAAPGHKTTCNGTLISTSNTFNYTADLAAGNNTFRFYSCGKSLTYRVYNNTRIIYSYTPQEDLSILNNETATVTAVCLSDADVKCAVNGSEYKMVPSVTTYTQEIPAGYSLFSCAVRFSGNTQEDLELGNIIITASLEDGAETVTAGSVTVLHTEKKGFFQNLIGFFTGSRSSTPNNVNHYTYPDAVSPYHDNGLGTALMCKIINDGTETLGVIGEKDTYHADYSTLSAGMLDYVTGMEISDAGYLRYILGSGNTVYGVNCELINNGYVMPQNKVVVNHVDDSSPSSTDIIFDIDWYIPVTVKCKPLTYRRGYDSYAFNISSFTAEYIEIKFYYSSEFYNSSLLQFDQSSVFSHSELYSSGENDLILRLYLKKAGQFYGFRIYRNERNQLVVSCKKHINGSLQGKVIMLDAGHGGLSMTGTAVADNSVAEKTVTLAIALKARDMLISKGATVLMTRTMDTSLTLEERCAILRQQNPDIYVSIHCDGTETETDAGTHSFYFRPYSQPLADQINQALATVYKTHIYAPTDTNYGKVDKPIKFYPFYVTRMNECPAVLVETGYMTNPVEGMILGTDNMQYWVAYGIVTGIENYFNANY